MFCAGVNVLDVLSSLHNTPGLGATEPAIWEATSWATFILFFWLPWCGYRIAPPLARPQLRLLLHLPVALAFSLCHVGGFVLLRRLAYWLMGSRYEFGPFRQNFPYELGKDAVTYVLIVAGFAFAARILCQRAHAAPPEQPAVFDIRDGTRLHRIACEDILAVASAGNYAEFILRDGRRLTMRSSLTALEKALQPYGFVRTHRSWLVNPRCMTALKAQGSGDYAVELGTLSAPLSRRYPQALARLRGVS